MAEKNRATLAPEWLLSYRKEWLSADVVAGLTAAAVVIPKALAYATIAGLPVQVGLYTVFVRGVALWLVGLNPQALDAVNRSTLGVRLGRERMHFNLERAVQAFRDART